MSHKLLAAFVAFIILTACERYDSRIEREIAELRGSTEPPGAKLLQESGPVRDAFAITATWEYEVDWDWDRYAEWVSRSLPSGYEQLAAGNSKLQFRRSLQSDVYTIDIHSDKAEGSERRVRVNFRALPN